MMALLLTAELLRFAPQSDRATIACDALASEAGRAKIQLTHSTTYRGGADVLVLWGPGHPARFEPMRRQLAGGGHVVALDLAYWDRDVKFRVSIDGAHPQAWVLCKDWPSSRLTADGVRIADLWDPDGPVLLAGLGDKARVQYGASTIDRWEDEMMRAAKASGRDVIYRAKKAAPQHPIDQALRGISCVITWHSNVAVDAIRMGIPAVCRDGAAAAVSPSTYGPGLQPLDPSRRDRFLANLAWFQWAPSEAVACWRWIRELLA